VASLERQAFYVLQQLQDIGVDPRALVTDLSESEDAAELIAELRATRQEARWRVIEPYHHRFAETFDAFTTALDEQKADGPAEVGALFGECHGNHSEHDPASW
jgi:hypothetical protein